MAPALGMIIPAVMGAAGIAGSALSANAARKSEESMFNRLHPAPTKEMTSNLDALRSRSSADVANAAANSGQNPFVQASAEGRDRLAGVRQKLAELQSMNQNRMAQGGASMPAPSNPFMG